MTVTMIPCAEITADDARIAGWWISADGQGSLDVANMTLAAALAELLAQCTDDEQRAGIMAGSIELMETL